MKKFTTTKVLLGTFLFTALFSQAQPLNIRMAEAAKKVSANNTVSGTKKLVLEPGASTTAEPSSQKPVALTNCTDKIDHSGNTVGPYAGIGGISIAPYEIGVFQVYPSYTGFVTGVEFTAAKYNTAPNPKVYAAIYDLIGSIPDVNAQSPPSAPFITVNTTNSSVYNITFASPIQVSGGFAVGIFVLSQDSAKVYSGPVLANVAPFYSYVYNSFGNTNSFSSYFNADADLLAKPIITTSVNPTWLAAKTSTGCGVPVVYKFTNTTAPSPSYVNNSIINPSGVTRSLDYGDGSAVVTNFPTSSTPLTHSYTTAGNYIANYTQTYVGWTNNCVESLTTAIVVDNPLPSFTYNSNGLTVMFTNTSQNLSNFLWNFGDLSVSTQNSPTHTFSSPGTYVVELEGTAPCGNVKYSLSITVSATTGIKENTGVKSSVSLFPNPASNLLKITTKSQNEFEAGIEIFNSLGSSVKTITTTGLNSGSTSVDVSDLSKGIYFIKLKTKEGDVVKPFVKE